MKLEGSPLPYPTKNIPSPLRLTASFDTNTTHELSCSSSDGSECDGDEMHHSGGNDEKRFENGNGTITDSPGGFEIECLEDKRQSPTRDSKLPHFHNNSYDENIEMVASSLILTRQQVFDKLEIMKKKNESTADVCRENTDEEHIQEEQEIAHLQECSICMEVFKVGDKISFSPAEGCLHVFHHDCLRRWLLRKTDCPCCRVIMLPVDRPTPKVEEGCDEPPTAGASSQTISNEPRMGNPRAARRSFFRPRPSKKDTRPWYHKNPTVIHERANKKCGTFCCAVCGVVVLKKDLREDLSTKTRASIKGRI